MLVMWILHHAEAIIAEELWNECNAILDAQQHGSKRTSWRTIPLFAGLSFVRKVLAERERLQDARGERQPARYDIVKSMKGRRTGE